VQVIDFVVEDSSVPTFGVNNNRRRPFIQALDSNFPSPGNYGSETWQAEAALEEPNNVGAQQRQFGINQNLEWYGLAFTLSHLFRWELLNKLGLVFNHYNLQRIPNLGCPPSLHQEHRASSRAWTQ